MLQEVHSNFLTLYTMQRGGYLSICSGIKGYNVTVTNGAQSGLASMAYAMSVPVQDRKMLC